MSAVLGYRSLELRWGEWLDDRSGNRKRELSLQRRTIGHAALWTSAGGAVCEQISALPPTGVDGATSTGTLISWRNWAHGGDQDVRPRGV